MTALWETQIEQNGQMGGASNSYRTGYKVFNEYMTHSVYLLFTSQMLNSNDQQIIENMKINGMKGRRKFIKFDEFYKKLKQLYQERKPNENIADLYPHLIDWCEKENAK